MKITIYEKLIYLSNTPRFEPQRQLVGGETKKRRRKEVRHWIDELDQFEVFWEWGWVEDK